MAHVFDLAGISNTVGNPFFALLAKGGNRKYRRRVGLITPNTRSNSTRSIATHPFDKLRAGSCKERKDGAPSGGMVYAKILKGGPPARSSD